MHALEYNPFAPEVRENPYPYYAELRRRDPVHRVESLGFWVLTRYDDVVFALRHPRLFSSSAMQFPELTSEYLAPNTATIISSDPPVHTRLRNLVNRAFTLRRVAALEPRIREITDELINHVRAQRQFDLIADLAMPLPMIVIAEMLGVDPDRREDFKHWSDDIVQLISGAPVDAQPKRLRESVRAFRAYFDDVLAARRAEPRDDLLSALIRAEEADQALTSEEILAFANILLVAGNVTTTNLVGNAILALLEHPAELAKVRADRSLVPALVEETLRYDGPVQGLFRLATEDVELGGTTIPAGAIVMPMFAAANRDERKFPEPDRFDVTRNSDDHIAFGFGIHFCLGAPLARLEAKVALEAIVTRFPCFSGPATPIVHVNSIFLRGPESLPLRLDAA